MMSKESPLLICQQGCDEAVAWMVMQMQLAGLKVMHTFDLHMARNAHVSCSCPHRGTDQCDCQMVVLLVYLESYSPITIIAHSYNHQTSFTIVDNPQQQADPVFERVIRDAVSYAPFCGNQFKARAQSL